MAEVAFVVSVPFQAAAALGDFFAIGTELAQRISRDVPTDGVVLKNVTKSDKVLVPDVFAALSGAVNTNPITARTGLKTTTKQTLAGAAAGDHTLGTAVALTDELVAVVSLDDTTHAMTDITSECTITGTTTVNNTGGTSTVGGHLVVVTRRV